jgi:hypothetical protein
VRGRDRSPFAHRNDGQRAIERARRTQIRMARIQKQNAAHDRQLQRNVAIWREQILNAGGEIRKEFNSRDLAALLGQKVNGPMSYLEKKAVAEELGFPMDGPTVKIPDHRFEIEWADGRIETKDLEHINPHTYSGKQIRAKAESGFSLTGVHISKGQSGRKARGNPDALNTQVFSTS